MYRKEIEARALKIANSRAAEKSHDDSLQNLSDEAHNIAHDLYYLQVAEAALGMSTCLRRNYGAVIVKDDRIVATGYNGSPRGETNCTDIMFCERERLHIPSGERYELCVSCHAEENAIIAASKEEMSGATIYICGREVATGNYANPRPCLMCRKMISNSGIVRVVGLVDGVPKDIDVSEPPRITIKRATNK